MRLLNPMEAAVRPLPVAAPGSYEAQVAEGRLALALETVSGQPPGCAAEAALRLALAEPLLAALDGWCGQALEWAWVGEGDAAAAGATARWAGVGVGARLSLPWAWLRSLPPPPPPLAQALQWSPAEAELVLAVLSPPPDDRRALEPGGAVLLPASFEADWFARLRAEGEAAAGGRWLVLDATAGLARGGAAAAAPGAADEAWEIRCAWPEPMAPERLLGWCDEPLAVDLALPVGLWPRPTEAPRDRGRCRARGRLMPWGEGRALWLESVEEEPRVDPV